MKQGLGEPRDELEKQPAQLGKCLRLGEGPFEREASEFAFENRLEEVGLRREVGVEGLLADAGFRSHCVHRGAREAVGEEQLPARRGDLFALGDLALGERAGGHES